MLQTLTGLYKTWDVGWGVLVLIQIASEKQELFRRVREDGGEDVVLSRRQRMCTYVVCLRRVEGLMYPLEGLVLVDRSCPRDEQRTVCTEKRECVCCWLSGTDGELGRSVWHTEMLRRGC